MNLQHLPRSLRRARLLAARSYGVRSIPRQAALRGDYDAGQVVLRWMGGEAPHG